MSWSKPVLSGRATEVSYDPETRQMVLTWRNGKNTTYFDVDEDVALQCSNAASVSEFVNTELTPNYKYRNG